MRNPSLVLRNIHKSMVNWNRIGLALLLSSSVLSCTKLYASKTPKGVDVTPILSVTLSDDVRELSSIKRLLPADATRSHYRDEMLLFGTPNNRDTHYVFRSVEISRFANWSKAQSAYASKKRTYTSGSDWKLHKEEGSNTNQYFSAYKTPWLNTNHGIPWGVITSPEMLVAFQKRNLLIVVYYTSYRDDVDYVREMNEDILYVGNLLRKSLAAIDSN